MSMNIYSADYIQNHDLMVVEDDVTLVPTVETDRCITYQDLEVTVKTCRKGSIQ